MNTVPALRALNIGDCFRSNLTVMKHNLYWPPPNYKEPKVETREHVFKELVVEWANKQTPILRGAVVGYWRWENAVRDE